MIVGDRLRYECPGCASTFDVADVLRGPSHGESTPVQHDGTGLFVGLPDPLPVGRYHSLIAGEATLPACWRITARSTRGEIMAIAHRTLPRWGVQFHPESILTPDGPAA